MCHYEAARSLLVLPVISDEEKRGVWSSNKKRRKSLQVDQEDGFEQRGHILELSPVSRGEDFKNIYIYTYMEIKSIQMKRRD